MANQQLDGNYKPISQNGYDPAGAQFVSPQVGVVKTGTDGTLYAPQVFSQIDGYKASYAAAIQGLVPAASATDIFTIAGSGTKTIRITRLEVSGIATTIVDTSVQFIVRSTADTGGTSTAPTAVKYDSTNPAATATIAAYTANPTGLGTSVGLVRTSKCIFNLVAPTAGSESGRLIEDFGDRPAQAVVLRGATQVLAVNLNGVTISGGSLDISVEWTEDLS